MRRAPPVNQIGTRGFLGSFFIVRRSAGGNKTHQMRSRAFERRENGGRKKKKRMLFEERGILSRASARHAVVHARGVRPDAFFIEFENKII